MISAKKIITLILVLIFIFPLFPFSPLAEGESKYSYPVDTVNAYPRPSAITVYTPENGSTTGVKENYNALEIVVSDNKVVSTEGIDNNIPADGFVAAIRGNSLKAEIEGLNLKQGDTVIFDEYNMEVFFINENYAPFYEKTINFDRYNSTRTENTIIIYNKGQTTNTNIWGSEVTVDENGFVAIIGGNNSLIPEGGFVISAVGRDRITELNAAAALGLKVTVDDRAKTITFSFSAESITGKMRVEYNNFAAAIDKAKENFAILDYSECENAKNKLNSLLSDSETSIENNDTAGAMIKKYEFEKFIRQSENLITEYPAVEERAVWLRPSNSDTRDKVNDTVKAIYDAGYNAICIELIYNSTAIFPVDSEKYLFSQDPGLKGFDVLKAYIEECHNYGIEVHGWMPCYRVSHGSTTYPKLAVSTLKPEWLVKAKSGTVEVGDTKGYFLNPALPEVKEFLLDFYRYILENYSLDGFQLDYIRYPYAAGEEFGYDDYTRQLFREKQGADPMDLTTSSPLWEEWCKFRASYVTDFVKEFSEMAREIRPDIFISADVAPDFRDVYKKYMQEAEIWLTEGYIDMAFPMAYGTNVIPLYSSFTVEAAGDRAYSYIGVSDYGVDVFKRQIVETREANADGFAFFSWSQYVAGNYVNGIASTALSVPALSPSYNATNALKAQAEYIKQHIEAIKYINPSALTSDIENLVKNTAEEIISATNSGFAEDCVNIIKTALDSLNDISFDEKAKEVLVSDISKALKIATLSKDKAKREYYEENQSGDESAEESREDSETGGEVSRNESDDSSQTGNSDKEKGKPKTAIIIGSALIGILLAITLIFIIKRRKQK